MPYNKQCRTVDYRPIGRVKQFTTMKLYRPLPRKVELLILSVVTLVCTNSAYNLFMTSPGGAEGRAAQRSPAAILSRGESFQTIDLGCLTDGMTVDAPSDRVRLKGRICTTGRGPASAPRQLLVENPASHHRAEVYFEKTWPAFTTEFIPLAGGSNAIELRYTAADHVDRKIHISVQKK